MDKPGKPGAYDAILIDIMARLGADNQMAQTIEECAELITALCHYRRKKISDKEVISEIADVAIMVDQLALVFGKEEVAKVKKEKLKRLRRMLKIKGIRKIQE